MSNEEHLAELKGLNEEMQKLKREQGKCALRLLRSEEEYVKAFCPFKVGDVVDIVAFSWLKQRREYKVAIKKIAREKSYTDLSYAYNVFDGWKYTFVKLKKNGTSSTRQEYVWGDITSMTLIYPQGESND